MKKLVSILMAIMMIAMVGAAFATDADNVYSGSGDTLATSVANGTTIPLKKSIVFFIDEHHVVALFFAYLEIETGESYLIVVDHY